jgi:RNA polymerase sigma-70 factor (ECF subfamily)
MPGMTEALQSHAEFTEAVSACLEGLFRYAMSLSHNQADAADLVQETYFRAARSFWQVKPDSNLKGWLYAIERNIWRNDWRHRHSGPQFIELDDEQQEPRSSDDPHASYVAKEERRIVRAAIAQLSPQYREVIWLREFENLSYQEIAVALGCRIGTVMSRLGRARDKLRLLISAIRERPKAPTKSPSHSSALPIEANENEATQREHM